MVMDGGTVATSGSPKGWSSPSDDGKTRDLNHFAGEGTVKRMVGRHWGLVTSLGKLALENKIVAYCFPQGVSHLFREIAARRLGVISTVL